MICIYRHRKLYVVMPNEGRWKKTEHHEGMQYNFALVLGDKCEVKLHLPRAVDEEFQRISVTTHTAWFGQRSESRAVWTLRKDGSIEVEGIGIQARTEHKEVVKHGSLVNLVWSMKHSARLIHDMMETFYSRSIIELLMHETEVDAERYDILQLYFDADTQEFKMNTLPIRPLKEAEEQSLVDRSESPQAWLDLFEKA